MGGAPGDEPAPAALEAGAGNRFRDAFADRVDPIAQPRAQLGQRRVGNDLVLDDCAVQQVGVHQAHRSADKPCSPSQERKARRDGAEWIIGIGLGAAEAKQPELGVATSVLDREPGRAHEANTEVGDRRLPLVDVVELDGADDWIPEQAEIPAGGRFVDVPFLGHEVGKRRERGRRRRAQLDVRDARVIQELVGDTPLRRRGAIAPPVLVLERDPARAQLLHAAEERDGDLRELLPFFFGGHAARVRGGGHRSAEPGRSKIHR
jgi:hypothetical protein